MTSKISGGCACGSIRYQCEVSPISMLNCHCRDCQRANGSAYAALMIVPKDAVRIEGEPQYYKIKSNAGNLTERGFCPTCGSQVIFRLEGRPHVLGLQAGSLDDPSLYSPTMEIFTSSAPPWDHLNPKLKHFAQGSTK